MGKKFSLKKSGSKIKPKKRVVKTQHRSLRTGRTPDESQTLRQKLYEFLLFASVGDVKSLQQLGYKGDKDLHFTQKWKLSPSYVGQVVHSNKFKPEYFKYVTEHLSRDLHPYLHAICTRGKEKVKGLQAVYPEEMGKALATRTIGLRGDADDAEFRNKFFGFDESTGENEDED